jgi:hypothetical protein
MSGAYFIFFHFYVAASSFSSVPAVITNKNLSGDISVSVVIRKGEQVKPYIVSARYFGFCY